MTVLLAVILLLPLMRAGATQLTWRRTANRLAPLGQFLISTENEILVTNSDASVAQQIEIPNLGFGQAQWSMDKRWIAFLDNGGDGHLMLFDNETVSLTSIDLEVSGAIADFGWSPTDYEIAVLMQADSHSIVYRYTLTTASLEQVWKCAGVCKSCQWTGDGRQLILLETSPEQNDTSGTTHLFSIDLQHDRIATLLTIPGRFESFRQNSTQTHYALFDARDLFIVDNSGNVNKVISSSDTAVWSVDGKYLAYTQSPTSSHFSVFVYVYDTELDTHYLVYPRPPFWKALFLVPVDTTRNFIFDWK